ncbi:MAG: leucine rich repeat containing protein, partial [Gammaproteobacteria bacterium]|nr:leucine rich repeat containing protein [Gammaproteobacteria bacterium]
DFESDTKESAALLSLREENKPKPSFFKRVGFAWNKQNHTHQQQKLDNLVFEVRDFGFGPDKYNFFWIAGSELALRNSERLPAAFQDNAQITGIGVRGLYSPEAVKTLKEILKNSRITSFFLEEAGEKMLEALNGINFLTTLNLCGQNIGPTGAKLLAQMLGNNCVQSLALSRNPLKIDGITAIASALCVNTSLTKFSLQSVSGIKGDGIIALATAFRTNKTLCELDLESYHHKLTPSEATMLVNALSENFTITSIKWNGLVESSSDYNKVREILVRNKFYAWIMSGLEKDNVTSFDFNPNSKYEYIAGFRERVGEILARNRGVNVAHYGRDVLTTVLGLPSFVGDLTASYLSAEIKFDYGEQLLESAVETVGTVSGAPTEAGPGGLDWDDEKAEEPSGSDQSEPEKQMQPGIGSMFHRRFASVDVNVVDERFTSANFAREASSPSAP